MHVPVFAYESERTRCGGDESITHFLSLLDRNLSEAEGFAYRSLNLILLPICHSDWFVTKLIRPIAHLTPGSTCHKRTPHIVCPACAYFHKPKQTTTSASPIAW
eukprot:3759785-Amphidinium_carterae.1